VPGPIDKPYPTRRVAASARWTIFTQDSSGALKMVGGPAPASTPHVDLLVFSSGAGPFHRGFIALGQDMSSARCPVVVLQPQSPFPNFGHRALRMALSAPREAWGFIEDSSYGPTVDQYPASPPVSPQAFPETPGPRVSSHSRGSLGLAWGRVRGTRSLVYPPLLSQGQRSSEVSGGISSHQPSASLAFLRSSESGTPTLS
jgi:hypothetical protein